MNQADRSRGPFDREPAWSRLLRELAEQLRQLADEFLRLAESHPLFIELGGGPWGAGDLWTHLLASWYRKIFGRVASARQLPLPWQLGGPPRDRFGRVPLVAAWNPSLPEVPDVLQPPEALSRFHQSVLELQPLIDEQRIEFRLISAAGHQRRTTGSYFTPGALVDRLLDSALEPILDRVLERNQAARDPAGALLRVRICDPACGDGVFLLAAARRLVRRLRVVAGEAHSTDGCLLRAVIPCLYGVDLDPLAVELCRWNLWLASGEPGTQLAYEIPERHIRRGNALLGATPTQLGRPLPPAALRPLVGDDLTATRELRRQIRQERVIECDIPAPTGPPATTDRGRPDPAAACTTPRNWHPLAADGWLASFVWPRIGEPQLGLPTARWLERWLIKPTRDDAQIHDQVQDLAADLAFCHWHLLFPEVFTHPAPGQVADNPQTGWSGGFDCILGNPPWERIKLLEREFFAARAPEIAAAPHAADRRRAIARLAVKQPRLDQQYQQARRRAAAFSHLVRHSGRYPLCGRGDVNQYALFAELSRELLRPGGRAGLCLPSGIATDETTHLFFQDLLERHELVSLHDFENRGGLFPGVHRSYKFCLFTVERRAATGGPWRGADVVCFAHQPAELDDPERHFSLQYNDLMLINPGSGTMPVFRRQRDAALTRAIHERLPVLRRPGADPSNPWQLQFCRMLDMTRDAHRFRQRHELEALGARLTGNCWWLGARKFLPLWEDWMMHQFEHRYRSHGRLQTTPAQLEDPHHVVLPRYWVEEGELPHRSLIQDGFLIGFRNRTRSTDRRTVICTVLPAVAVGNTIPLLRLGCGPIRCLLPAVLSSFVLDYVACQKLGGLNLNYFIFEQLPVPPPETFRGPAPWEPGRTIQEWMLPRILELTYTSWELHPFALECGHPGPPFRWDATRRRQLRAELDAACFSLYGLSQDEAAYVLDTFSIIQRQDRAQFGHYRTRDEILAAMRALELATATSTRWLV